MGSRFKVRAPDDKVFAEVQRVINASGLRPGVVSHKRRFAALDDLTPEHAALFRSVGAEIVEDVQHDPEDDGQQAAPAPFSTKDERVAGLVKAMASAAVQNDLAAMGVMAIDPRHVARRVDEVWAEWLWHAENVLDAALEAVLSHPDGLNGLKRDLAKVKADYQATLPEWEP